VPVLMFFVSIYLVIAPIMENPQIEYLYASLYIVSGLFVYIPFVRNKYKLPTIIGKCGGDADLYLA